MAKHIRSSPLSQGRKATSWLCLLGLMVQVAYNKPNVCLRLQVMREMFINRKCHQQSSKELSLNYTGNLPSKSQSHVLITRTSLTASLCYIKGNKAPYFYIHTVTSVN